MLDNFNGSLAARATPATWAGFVAMCVGMFMAILDIQVVATSLPTIQSALDINPDDMSWIQTAYLIAEVIAIPLTGVLTRLLTMRWLYVSAISVFVLSSIGCALSASFGELVLWRVFQGFSGGTLIPAVFSAVFILFPVDRQVTATTIGGVLAVLAPTIGPTVGGWITATYSWHWLFLINAVPGIVSALFAARLLPREAPRLGEIGNIDFLSLLMMAGALTCLELSLTEAPTLGWLSGIVTALLTLFLILGIAFVTRTLRARNRIVQLENFSDRNFLIGSVLSFVLGIGLFGSVYLMPVFLAFVRGHDSLDIGRTMLVTGVAQLITAPIAVQLEKRIDPRLLSFIGFAVFMVGLAMSSFQDPRTDFDAMFWPQVVRGAAIMFCLLPPTRLALGALSKDRVPDASGLFNLMRNLGGAIGIALIDTVIYTRSPVLGDTMMAELAQGNAETARFVGVSLDTLSKQASGTFTDDTMALLDPIVQNAAAAQAINEAWGMIALLTLCALLLVPFARKPAAAADIRTH
ncbi:MULTISPECIES: DHA2 family efflux MFS transporter permease subunit [unclassified Sinorhizobium]|uniref:DHA2 family efflux MFS transporter permease subunit n=1 Tax=unclassified Sinorhizobium TaxID=2613772 RepID=UPI0035260F12